MVFETVGLAWGVAEDVDIDSIDLDRGLLLFVWIYMIEISISWLAAE